MSGGTGIFGGALSGPGGGGAGGLGDAVITLRTDMRQLIAGLDQAKRAAESAAGHIGGSLDSIDSKAKKTGSGFGLLKSAVGEVTSVVGGVAKGFAIFGFAANGVNTLTSSITGLGRALLGSNASLEQTATAFTTLLGSAEEANDFIQDMRKFAAETPFEFPELAENARLMLAFGTAAEDVIPHLTNIGDAIGALGGGPQQIDRVVRALGQMQAKGRVMAEEMNQIAEIGINGFAILAEQMGLSVAEVRKLGEEGKLVASEAIPLILKGMDEAFGGGMQKQAKTFNGLLSTLKDNLGIAFQRITYPIFEQAKEALVDLVAYTNTVAFEEKIQRWIDKSVEFADGIRNFVTDYGPGMLRIFQTVGAEVALVAGKVKELSDLANTVLSILRESGQGDMFSDQLPTPEGGFGGRPPEPDESKSPGFLSWFTDLDSAPIDWINDLGKAIRETDAYTADYTGRVDNLTNAQIAQLRATANLGVGYSDSRYGLQETAKAMLEALPPQQEYLNHLKELEGTIPPLSEAMADMTAEEIIAAAQAQAMAESVAANVDALTGYENALGGVVVSTDEAGGATNRFTQAQADYGKVSQQVSASEEALMVVRARAAVALQAVTSQAEKLAAAYQANLSVQEQFNAQGGEYSAQLSSVEKALEILHQRQEDGVPLTAEQTALLENEGVILDRLKGGIDDAALATGQAAGQNALFMSAQDQLNGLLATGAIDVDTYNARLAEAARLYGVAGGAAGESQTAQEILASAIQTNLIPTLDNLARKIEYIAKPWLIQIDAATEAAERELLRIKGLIDLINSSGGAPVSAEGTLSSSTGAFATGGLVTKPTLAVVGEKEPEIIIPLSQIPASPQDFLGSGDTAPPGAAYGPAAWMPFIEHLLVTLQELRDRFGEGQEEAKAFAEMVGATVKSVSDALALLIALGEATVTYSPEIQANVDQLVHLTYAVVARFAQAAESFSTEGMEHASEFAQSAEDSTSALNAGLEFLVELGDQTLRFTDDISTNIDHLVHLIYAVNKRLGDAAVSMSSDFLAHATEFNEAAETGLGVLSEALEFLTDLNDVTFQQVLSLERANRAIGTLVLVSYNVAAAIRQISQTWDVEIEHHIEEFSEATGNAFEVLSDALSFLDDLSDATADGVQWNTVLYGHVLMLGRRAREVAEAFKSVAADWTGVGNDEMDALADAVSSASGGLSDILAFLSDLRDASLEGVGVEVDIEDAVNELAAKARYIADAFRLVSDTWGDETDESVKSLSDAVGSSTSALGDTLGFLIDLAKTADLNLLTESEIAEIATGLAGRARIIADAFEIASAGWDVDVTPRIEEFASSAESSLSALGAVGDALTAILTFQAIGGTINVEKVAAEMVMVVRTIVRAVEQASLEWAEDGLTAVGQWSEDAGKAVSLMGDVASDYEAISESGKLSQKHMQVFQANFKIVLELIRDLRIMAEPYLADALAFQAIAEAIAAALEAAASAISAVKGATEDAKDDAAESNQNLADATSFGSYGGGGSRGGGGSAGSNLADLNSLIEQAVGSLENTLADNLNDLYGVITEAENRQFFDPETIQKVGTALGNALDDLGLDDALSVGQRILEQMGLDRQALEEMGLDPATIDDLQQGLGEDFLEGSESVQDAISEQTERTVDAIDHLGDRLTSTLGAGGGGTSVGVAGAIQPSPMGTATAPPTMQEMTKPTDNMRSAAPEVRIENKLTANVDIAPTTINNRIMLDSKVIAKEVAKILKKEYEVTIS